MRHHIGAAANAALAPAGVELKRRGVPRYNIAAGMVAAARADNMTLCDWVERLWGQAGFTQRVIDEFSRYGVFDPPSARVCEIGAGTGRYAEKIMALCAPESYESYENDPDWEAWLASEYPVTSRDADGETLAGTATASVDLVHAHGVFVVTPFLVTYSYLEEMMRVVNPGGWVAFDCYTEDCMSGHFVERWQASEHRYPCIVPAAWVRQLFTDRGFTPMGEFTTLHGEGISRYLLFRRGT